MKKPYGSRKTKTKTVDVVIVGGGIAGLYAAYKLRKKDPSLDVRILEKNDYLGGRVKLETFRDHTVNMGAGIIRFRDFRFKKLLRDLGVATSTFWAHVGYSFQSHVDIGKALFLLHSRLDLATDADTVRTYMPKVLDNGTLAQFQLMAGYDDYLNDPAREFFAKPYDCQDMFYRWKAVSIKWQQFVDKLTHKVRADLEMTVVNIQRIQLEDFEESTYFLVMARHRQNLKNIYYSCEKLIMATTVNAVQKLIPEKESLYQNIKGQPFFRVYGKIDSEEPLATSTIVTQNILRKVIPIKDGIYMIAYNDNQNAVTLYNNWLALKTKAQRIAFFTLRLQEVFPGKKFKLVDIVESFWNIGTHYFLPSAMNRRTFLKQAQNPFPNLLVVGEMVSTHQGWVEGALESVDNVIS